MLVVGDDHGWPDSGFMGSELARTPHLDELADGGVVFTHAFTTASSCRPSLLSLLTGLHPVQIEARLGQDVATLPLGSPAVVRRVDTLPRLLATRGYVSFQGGKYWEGDPAEAGFTSGAAEAGPRRFARVTLEPLWRFFEERGEAPFFVWFAPMLPHVPFDAPAELRRPFAEAGLGPPEAGYFANITRLDDSVGELLARLEAEGLRERTLVVYVSDNGWDPTPEFRNGRGPGLGGARGKYSLHELGFRTPLVLHWPGTLPSGRRDERLVSTVDLFATLLDFAGIERPPAQPGRSLRPVLLGTGGFPRERVVAGMTALRNAGGVARKGRRTHAETAWFVRTPSWRYLWYPEQDREELYRIAEDPFEQVDVAPSHPDETSQLRRDIERWIAASRASAGHPRKRPFQRWLENRAGERGAL